MLVRADCCLVLHGCQNNAMQTRFDAFRGHLRTNGRYASGSSNLKQNASDKNTCVVNYCVAPAAGASSDRASRGCGGSERIWT
jgi:hypothetical protein